ncbi:hypothetical protein BDV98DRAFT_560410 [Pterulicium gracile]|uniref:Uncharacterized protein n=1 Tax=Pterulicium gracile TaxID=1884261 RepID=A0A5C3QZE2_9AGAR|nr:hypothetical protein BDV98DRAFT_560410 [Pterula gracilis]
MRKTPKEVDLLPHKSASTSTVFVAPSIICSPTSLENNHRLWEMHPGMGDLKRECSGDGNDTHLPKTRLSARTRQRTSLTVRGIAQI